MTFDEILNKFIKAILAGVAISAGGLLYVIFKDYKLLASILFSIGLIIVCTQDYNLFTGKVGKIFEGNLKNNLINLPISLIGNFVGAALIGLFVACLPIYQNLEFSETISYAKINSNYMFEEALFCGIMVYLAVFNYNTFKAKVNKILGIIIPITIFVFFGGQHCVANVFYFNADLTFSIINVVVVVIGNSIGAIICGLIKLIEEENNARN